MKRICVFCGSNFGNKPDYELAAIAMGQELARRGLSLVYGGGKVGLMGIIADAVLDRLSRDRHHIKLRGESLRRREASFDDL